MTLPASQSDQRRFWDRQVLEAWGSTAAQEASSTPARRFAGDAHLYADQQYGSSARCADIRGVITPDKFDQDDSQWGADLFMNTPAPSQYDWLRLRGIHARSPVSRIEHADRSSTSPTPTPPATHDAFYYGNVAERCEAAFRQGLVAFADGPPRAFADVDQLLLDVQAACVSPDVVLPDGPDVDPVVWRPELAGSGFCSLDLPVAATLPLTTGYHPADTLQPIIHAHLLAQPDFVGTDFNGDGIVSIDERVRSADLLVEHYARGLSVAQFNSLSSGHSAAAATNSRSLACTWGTGAAACSEQPPVLAPVDQASYRPGDLAGVPPLPSDGNRCWYFNPTLQSWRMKGADEPTPIAGADPREVQHGQGPGLFEEFWGFVESRPAPHMVVSLPLPRADQDPGVIVPVSLDTIIIAVSRSIQERMDFSSVESAPAVRICGDRYRAVFASNRSGDPLYAGFRDCWMHYANAVPHVGPNGDFFERVRNTTANLPPDGDGVGTPLRFPLMRHYQARHVDDVRPADRSEHGLSDVSAERDCPGPGCPGAYEPSVCPFLSHRGQLRTSFTLTDYHQPAGPDGTVRRLERRNPDPPGSTTSFRYDGWRYLLVTPSRAERGENDIDELTPINAFSRDGNVLVFDRPVFRPDGVRYFTEPARLPWVGYDRLADGSLVYTSRTGDTTAVDLELFPQCQDACPYFDFENPNDREEEYICSFCPSEEEYDSLVSQATTVCGSENCSFYNQYDSDPLNGSWPTRTLGYRVYFDQTPISQFFRRSECYYHPQIGEIRCGSDGRWNRLDEDLYFQDVPYRYCPEVSRGSSAVLTDFVIPEWEPPSTPPRYLGPDRTPLSLVDSLAAGATIAAAPSAPSPVSSGYQHGPNGCGVYPADWVLVGSAAEWDAAQLAAGPTLCTIEFNGIAARRGGFVYFDPLTFDIGFPPLGAGSLILTWTTFNDAILAEILDEDGNVEVSCPSASCNSNTAGGNFTANLSSYSYRSHLKTIRVQRVVPPGEPSVGATLQNEYTFWFRPD